MPVDNSVLYITRYRHSCNGRSHHWRSERIHLSRQKPMKHYIT